MKIFVFFPLRIFQFPLLFLFRLQFFSIFRTLHKKKIKKNEEIKEKKGKTKKKEIVVKWVMVMMLVCFMYVKFKVLLKIF